MRKKFRSISKKSLLSILLGLGFLFFVPNRSAAQDLASQGISLSPIHYEFSADPGGTVSEKIKVYNPTDSQFLVNMETEDFEPVGDAGQVVVRENNNRRYSLKDWVTVEPKEFTLAPRAEQFVNFTIRVPNNADPGGKYGSILAVMGGTQKASQTGSVISQKVGSLVLLSVSGPVTESLSVEEIAVSPFSEYGPVPFAIRFENQGTVHVKPRGFLTITDMLGRKTSDLEIEGQNVIPGASRKIEVKLDRKWLFGKYSARLVGDYGQERIPLNSPVVYFWVIPWKVTLAVLLLISLAVYVLYLSRKRWAAALKILFKGENR